MLEELPFDQYQRYGALRLAADHLRAILGRPLTVLDVGDWNGLAARFCPTDRCVWLDPTGAGSEGYIQADGAALPFADAAFDLVACLDTLEHVPRERRALVVAELARAAVYCLVIAVPVADDGAAEYERELAEYVRDVLGGEQQQLREHAEHGLPTRAEARSWLPSAWQVVELPSGLLPDWLTMMVAKHALLAATRAPAVAPPSAEPVALHLALDRAYNTRRAPLDPALPAYRHVLIATHTAAPPTAGRPAIANDNQPPAASQIAQLPATIAARLPAPRTKPDPLDTAGAHAALLAAHAHLAGVGPTPRSDQADPVALAHASRALAAATRALHDRHAAAQHELARAQQTIAAYERGRFIRAAATATRLRRRLGL